MQADILRKKFLDFFKARKHKIVESDSLVPKDDPTVLFTPAGMNQFKKQFLGHISGFRRAATSQRCLRTDDLDKVGKTPSHHTFFEMLGNFSFGDYFKKEAISFAWEFITEELKIKKEKLWVSIYRDDAEAYNIWKDKIKVPQNKIIKLGDKENFWPAEAKEKGPSGPCGPCSEIFFDQGRGCGKPDCSPACSCGRFVEVWNLVFTQFNRQEGGALEPLPKKNIDTGMGLERLAAVMQGVANNFETDLFRPILNEIEREIGVGKRDLKGTVGYGYSGYPHACAVADHIRAIVFCIFDGALPSNEGRGYVVRKIIRKGVLELQALGIKKPFLSVLVPLVAQVMKNPYPDLQGRRENIAQIIEAEELSFIAILKNIDSYVAETWKTPYNMGDPAKVASLIFKSTDTYGYPLELIMERLKKNNFIKNIDEEKAILEAYEGLLEEQKIRSKQTSAMKGDVFDLKEMHLAGAQTNFLGYAKYETTAKIIKIIKGDAPVNKINTGEEAKIILDKTVFYPESGGQVGDTGEFTKAKSIFQVADTQKFDKVVVHKGIVKEGGFKIGDEVKIKIDIERRLAIARNHTATHLLQAALRKILGAHVQQQGSLVTFDKLRFDFTHFRGISKEELDRIEETVNSCIINNYRLTTQLLVLSEAKKKGALAFFGEKYAGRVRMVSVVDFSKELCAGTHLDSTGQIGLFKITQEGSVASGVRRIEAVTATGAFKIIKEREGIITEASALLGVPCEQIAQELEKKISRIKELEKQLNSQKLDLAKNSMDALIQNAAQINNIRVISEALEGMDMDLLRRTVDLIKQKTNNSVIILGSIQAGKALLVMAVTEDLVQKGLDASKLIRDVAGVIGGSGGGRKDFAQAGGNKPENLVKAFQELKNIISNLK